MKYPNIDNLILSSRLRSCHSALVWEWVPLAHKPVRERWGIGCVPRTALKSYISAHYTLGLCWRRLPNTFKDQVLIRNAINGVQFSILVNLFMCHAFPLIAFKWCKHFAFSIISAFFVDSKLHFQTVFFNWHWHRLCLLRCCLTSLSFSYHCLISWISGVDSWVLGHDRGSNAEKQIQSKRKFTLWTTDTITGLINVSLMNYVVTNGDHL